MKIVNKLKIFFKQFNSPLIYILIIATLISFYLKEHIDAIIILVVIFLNAIIGCIQEVKADEALEALKKLSSPHSLIKVDGKVVKILSSEIKVGDILVLNEGQVIAADATLLKVNSLRVDESSLTGESLRVEKDINNKSNSGKVFESTVVVSGNGEALVTAVGKDTEFGKISSFVKEKKVLTPLQMKLNTLSKILGVGTILICLLIFIISLLRNGNVYEVLITSISLAVAVIPEGLMAIVTITLSIGVQKLVNVNTIVRHLPSVETLGSVSLVCSDKTGTITENRMNVEKVFTFNKDDLLITSMILCNDATLSSGDPTEIAMLHYAQKHTNLNQVIKNYPRIKEIPFSSDSKMMTTIHKYGNEKIAFSKGAFEVIIKNCQYYYDGDKILPRSVHFNSLIESKINSFYDKALRVLAFSCHYQDKEIFIGVIGEKDPIRLGVESSIKTLSEAGIKTIMITGDHLKTAKAIGEELQIYNNDSNICLGENIDNLSETQLKDVTIFARVTPLDKMKIVKKYKSLGYITAMTGDGVNDAPSLKEADVGIAMGLNGTEVARSVSDIILTDDNFSTIEKAIETGRVIYDNIKKSVIFLLSSNLAEVLIMFLCLILNFPIPLIAIHILWVNLISDSLPALALGSDKPTSDVMKQGPRKKESSLLANGGWKCTLLYGSMICLTTFIGFILIPLIEIIKVGAFDIRTLYQNLMIQYQNDFILRKSRTIAFTILGVSELFHMIGMSDQHASILSILKKKNYLMFIVIIIGVFLQVIVTEIPVLVTFFRTESLTFLEWIWLLLISCFPLVVHEAIR